MLVAFTKNKGQLMHCQVLVHFWKKFLKNDFWKLFLKIILKNILKIILKIILRLF